MKVSELSGTALDFLVARAEGKDPNCVFAELLNDDYEYFRPSSNWLHGGPIIEREGIKTSARVIDGNRAIAWAAQAMNGGWYSYGDTPLEAAMRCHVASKFGEEVGETI